MKSETRTDRRMADPKLHATAVAVSLALLTTGEQAMAQSASEIETRLEAGALMSQRDGTLPLSALARRPRHSIRRPTTYQSAAAARHWLSGSLGTRATPRRRSKRSVALLYGVRAEVLANASRAFFDAALAERPGGRRGTAPLREQSRRGLAGLRCRPARSASPPSRTSTSAPAACGRKSVRRPRGSVTSFFFTKAG